MPFFVCIKLNATWDSCPTQIVQLDKSRVKVLRELKNFLLTLYMDTRIHHTMDIVVVDVPKTYGMWLSRDWSKTLKGYFATDRSHLWLTYNGIPNHIKINKDPFMK